jgi:hypothetical protein
MLDRTSARIMSGPYSITPATTIPFIAAEQEHGRPHPYFFECPDMSGDGANDIITYRFYGSSYPYRNGFRVINGVTGQDVYLFDSSGYSYLPRGEADLDNDGFVELSVARSVYPPPSNSSYEVLAFQTAGRATPTQLCVDAPPTVNLTGHLQNEVSQRSGRWFHGIEKRRGEIRK